MEANQNPKSDTYTPEQAKADFGPLNPIEALTLIRQKGGKVWLATLTFEARNIVIGRTVYQHVGVVPSNRGKGEKSKSEKSIKQAAELAACVSFLKTQPLHTIVVSDDVLFDVKTLTAATRQVNAENNGTWLGVAHEYDKPGPGGKVTVAKFQRRK